MPGVVGTQPPKSIAFPNCNNELDGLWRIEFIHEINKFLEPPHHIVSTEPWSYHGKPSCLFFLKPSQIYLINLRETPSFLDGIEVCLFFAQTELSVHIDTYKEHKISTIIEVYDYQNPDEFDAEKIAKFIKDIILMEDI
jgi:hypothetical protein